MSVESRHVREPMYAAQALGILVLGPALCAGLLARLAVGTWMLWRAFRRTDYSGHFMAWALFGYLGLPLLMALVGVDVERGVVPQ